MHLFKVEREWSASNSEFNHIYLGDAHVGSTHCDSELLAKHVNDIAQMENVSVFLMGDMGEWILPGDKRWRPECIDQRFWPKMATLPMAYLDYLEELFAPIAEKIELVHDGTHEKKLFPTMYPGSELCSRLRKRVEQKFGAEKAMNCLRYSPGPAFTKFTWKTKTSSDYRTLVVNTAHGWRAGRYEGGKVEELDKMFKWCDADVIMRAHSHSLFAKPGPVRISPNPTMTKLVEKQTIYGMTGSYLKTVDVQDWPGYAEEKDYPPLPRGYVRVHIKLLDEGLAMSPHVQL